MEQSIQNLLDIESSDEIIDIKLSIENFRSTPDQLLEQVKQVINADKEGILSEFIDY